MFFFFFSFLPVLPTIALFWHDDKTKKSTISNQNQALDMLLQKKKKTKNKKQKTKKTNKKNNKKQKTI